jgi:ABC-2 type transport system permease protein
VSLILGRTLGNVVTIGVQGAVLVVVAIPFGLRPSWDGVAASVLLICLLALGISAASYAMGLILKDEDAFAPFIQGVSLPLLLLSGILLPMSLAPAWLDTASKVNPLTHVVDATRALFRGDFGNGDVLIGIGVAVALSALLAWWGTRTFQRQSA